VETGVPGVKPPEPVIEVVCNQCLTHKVVTSSWYSFCTHPSQPLPVVWNQPTTGPKSGAHQPRFFVKVGGPTNWIELRFEVSLRDWTEDFIAGLPKDSSFWDHHCIPRPVSHGKFDGPPRRSWKSSCQVILPSTNFRKNFVKQENEEETDEEKLGWPSWAPRSSPGFEPLEKLIALITELKGLLSCTN